MDYVEVSHKEWNKQYDDGEWDYLSQPDEGARYAVILGYVQRYVPDGKILDLGCGAGGFWEYLNEQQKMYYTGIDFSCEAIRLAQKKSGESFIVADVQNYRPGRKYDAIIFNEVLYYLPYPLSVVKRYTRYLNPGGIIVVSMFLYPHIFDKEYKIVVRILKELEKESSLLVLDKATLVNEIKWKREWHLAALRVRNCSPVCFSIEKEFNNKFRNYKVGSDKYKGIMGEEFFLRTESGTTLYCMYFSANNTKNTIIISHGYINHIPYLKYLNLFYQKGFNVLVYDMGGFGKSSGEISTIGYYGKWDLSSCIDWVVSKCGKDCIIGLFGDDIGAAVSIQNMEIDKRADFCIADSSFTDMPSWLKFSMRKQKNKLPVWLRYLIKCIFFKVRTGISYKWISPLNIVSNIDKPILFIHGKKDNVIPYKMSVRLYNRKKGVKKIKILNNASHVTSYTKNGEEYDKVVTEFLKEIGIQ